MLEDFVAHVLLRNRHVQTLGAALPLFAPPRGFDAPATQWRKYALPGPRGGSLLGVGWWHVGAPSRPTVIVVHGVGGSSESRYVVRAAVALYRAGYHVLRLNLRGAGESAPDAPSLYHAGLIEDVEVVARALALDARVTKTMLLGFSLGGNVVLKAAGAWRGRPPGKVTAIAAVSAPLELAPVSRHLESGATLPYRTYLVRNLVGQAARFRALHPAGATYTLAQLRKVRTLWQYDDVVVAPMHGFPSARAYYEAASAGPDLGFIEVPTLTCHAEDDPMVPGALVAPSLTLRSRAVEVAWTRQGGHVGWFAGLAEASWVNTWAVNKVVAFFARHA